MRSLRTDSVAALKPITGTSTATSCKSPVPGDPDAGIYYGAWIIFDKADDSFQTGSACVDISNTPLYGTSSKTVLKNGVTFGDFPSGTDREVVLFTFDGDVYSASHPSGDPDPSWVQNPTAAAQVTTPPKSIELISGTSHYYVYFNGSGLVCSQEETPPGTCAN